ncbi:DUF4231 domain-containing protein [Candidatus Bathyarchaeota archaeon]|nr:DUF4231 domain-containing protein [Candidatus Bathyarchaeota archaeon]
MTLIEGSDIVHLGELALELQDYPISYQASDSCAVRAQEHHFLFVRARIILLIAISAIAPFASNQTFGLRTPATASLAIFFIVLLAVTAIADRRKFNMIWFSCRFIAESVKKETWNFIMKVQPYDRNLGDSVAEGVFLDRTKKILASQPTVADKLAPHLKEGDQVTRFMKEVRKRSFEDRRQFYVQNRLHDQRTWYADRTKSNQSQESKWQIIIWMLQIAAFAVVIIGIIQNLFVNSIGILTTAVAATTSWISARSYLELSRSYGLVTQELMSLEAQLGQASSEEELEQIVIDVENTISREHTTWSTRRLS